jgi:DNA transformation protein
MSRSRSRPPALPGARSLKVTDAFRAFVLDQLEELGDVTPKPMFGGVGLYCRGVFFGIIARDVLYLKVGDANRPDYIGAGMKPFKPYPDRSGTMQYYAVPVDVLESSIELAEWARRAVAVAESGPATSRRRARKALR